MPAPVGFAQNNGMLSGADGVQTNISDFLRPGSALKVADNVNMVKRGIITSRYNGWTRQRAGAFNSGAQFLDFAVFTDATGARTLCFQVGSKLYSYDGATETAMQSGLSTTNPPCIRMFAPYASGTPTMILANGVDQPYKFTSTGAASGVAMQLNGGNYPQSLSAPLPVRSYSKPQFFEPFNDRLAIAGFTGASAFDVLLTNAGTAETCTQSTPLVATDGGVFQVNPALGPITGMKAFKLSNADNTQVLLVAQAQGVSIIVGSNATDFQMRTLTAEYGIPSNRCWVQVMNDLWFLATDGIRRFSTLVQNANLLNASMSFIIQDIISALSSGSAQWACMAHHRIYQEVVLWCPVSGSSINNQGIVLNYNNDKAGDPTQVNPIFFTKSGTTVSALLDYKNTLYGGGYDGLLQVHYSGNLYDTAPVSWEIRTALVKPKDYENSCYLEKALVLTEGLGQQFLANAFTYAQLGNTLQRNQMNPVDFLIREGVSSSGLTILNSWTLGTSAFEDSIPRRHVFQPQGHGAYWELQLKGNQADHVIDWLGIEYRIKEGGPNA
jgi:hypothetical protein